MKSQRRRDNWQQLSVYHTWEMEVTQHFPEFSEKSRPARQSSISQKDGCLTLVGWAIIAANSPSPFFLLAEYRHAAANDLHGQVSS
jgi:hypothetical protein